MMLIFNMDGNELFSLGLVDIPYGFHHGFAASLCLVSRLAQSTCVYRDHCIVSQNLDFVSRRRVPMEESLLVQNTVSDVYLLVGSVYP